MEIKAGQIWALERPRRTVLIKIVRIQGRYVTFRKCDCVGWIKSNNAFKTVRIADMVAPKFTRI